MVGDEPDHHQERRPGATGGKGFEGEARGGASKPSTGGTTSPKRTMWKRDNLDVLRGLNDNCIDLVYADPPFKSNKNYQVGCTQPQTFTV